MHLRQLAILLICTAIMSFSGLAYAQSLSADEELQTKPVSTLVNDAIVLANDGKQQLDKANGYLQEYPDKATCISPKTQKMNGYYKIITGSIINLEVDKYRSDGTMLGSHPNENKISHEYKLIAVAHSKMTTIREEIERECLSTVTRQDGQGTSSYREPEGVAKVKTRFPGGYDDLQANFGDVLADSKVEPLTPLQ